MTQVPRGICEHGGRVLEFVRLASTGNIRLVEAFFLFINLSHDLLILGASTRAAAFSAIRGGFHPRCADYFADRDLADALSCRSYRSPPRRSRVRRARRIPRPLALVLYRRSRKRSRLRRRDLAPAHSLGHRRANRPRCPQSRPCRRRPGPKRHPLPRRALRSPGPATRRELAEEAAGIRRRTRHRAARPNQTDIGSPAHYFQERIDGPSFSALFMGERERAGAADRRHPAVDRHRRALPLDTWGASGPCRTEPLRRLGCYRWATRSRPPLALPAGSASTSSCRDGIPWPVEVNPRYTASLEIHELAAGRSLLAEHQQACEASTQQRDRRRFASISHRNAWSQNGFCTPAAAGCSGNRS